jgi:23S rRNA (uracil1939-C5)-methyltransferase
MAAPVRKDEEVELQVDSLAYGGNGVARLNGFVVFVRRGLPGDRVRARVTKVKRGFAEALATEVLEPSAHRVEAPCAHYPACGGCRFQDLDYAVQAAAKEEQVRDALQRIGGIAEAPVEPILAAASQFFYRNKLEYSFTQTPSGPALGFHKAGRWDEVLEVEKCWLTTDLGNAIRNAVRDWAREEGLVAYDQAEQTGYLRHLVVREGRNTGQALVMLVTAPGEKFERGYLVEVLTRFPEVKSIHWAINDSPSEVTNLPSTLLWGEEAIEEELLGHRFRIRPNAFLQTNTEMAEQLYALAIEYAGLTGAETVYDLYCGTGTISASVFVDRDFGASGDVAAFLKSTGDSKATVGFGLFSPTEGFGRSLENRAEAFVFEIFQTKFQRVDAQLVREFVNGGFAREVIGGGSERAIRALLQGRVALMKFHQLIRHFVKRPYARSA